MAVEFDVAIIGAGVAGTMVARELARYRLKVLVLEKGAEVGSACTKASNSVIHSDSGAPGTNIRRFTAESHRLYDGLCRDLSVAFERCGELFVALDEREVQDLEAKVKAAEAKGVEMRRLTQAEVLDLEPALNRDLLGGALAPIGGVLCGFELAIALYENAVGNGVRFLFDTEVKEAHPSGDGFELVTQRGDAFRARYVVNAAGAWGAKVASMFGHDGLDVVGMLGQRVIFDCRNGAVRHIVDRVSGSGVVAPPPHGNLLAGRCDGELVEVEDEAFTTAAGIQMIINEAKSLFPSIQASDVIRSFAGVWPERADILVEASETVPGLVNICLPPPGLTGCPAAAREAVRLLQQIGLDLVENECFNPCREPIPDFSEMSPREQNEMIRKDPRWGRVVCRCETVTEGEILEAIRRGARTLDGVKYRVRAGMGRCQGGFCGPRILAILAREQGCSMNGITKKGGGSWMVTPRAGDGSPLPDPHGSGVR